MFAVSSCPWLPLFDSAPERLLRCGESLFLRGDDVHAMHLLREGRVTLGRMLESGTELMLHTAVSGELIAQASLFSERYHCDASCRTEVRVASIPKDALLLRMQRDETMAALARSSSEVQALRSRVEVLRLRRLTDRVDAYLALYGSPVPGSWVDVADWIGVTPPALYRELARRRTL